MNNFASFATDILLANHAVVNKGLTLGKTNDPENTAYLRSAGKDSLTQGRGFYIENTGKFNFGDSDNYVDWDGQKLFVNGDIGGEINKITVGNPTPWNEGIEIGSTGIFAYDGTSTKSFELTSSGSAYFRGRIESSSGEIGG